MTNELGSALQDIEAKAERKREALEALKYLSGYEQDKETIRKYIEEN